MSSCSKAPRGLFVQVEVGRVFTAIAISPSRGSRQLLTRYAIHAGRNLPDKELRYRRTVIVTAAVYRSLSSKHPHTKHAGYLSPSLTGTGQASARIPRISPSHGPVFLINSRLALVSCGLPKEAGHIANLRPACLPSSLSLFLSLALVFSTNPPVSDCGTAYLKSHREPFLAG